MTRYDQRFDKRPSADPDSAVRHPHSAGYAVISVQTAWIKNYHPTEFWAETMNSVITKTDKRRSSYYNFYTGNKWGKYDNYDMAINSSNLGIEGTAQLITICARELMSKTEAE